MKHQPRQVLNYSVYFLPPIALWLIFSFIEWNLYWLSELGDKSNFDRYVVLLVLLILYIILSIFKQRPR